MVLLFCITSGELEGKIKKNFAKICRFLLTLCAFVYIMLPIVIKEVIFMDIWENLSYAKLWESMREIDEFNHPERENSEDDDQE